MKLGLTVGFLALLVVLVITMVLSMQGKLVKSPAASPIALSDGYRYVKVIESAADAHAGILPDSCAPITPTQRLPPPSGLPISPLTRGGRRAQRRSPYRVAQEPALGISTHTATRLETLLSGNRAFSMSPTPSSKWPPGTTARLAILTASTPARSAGYARPLRALISR